MEETLHFYWSVFAGTKGRGGMCNTIDQARMHISDAVYAYKAAGLEVTKYNLYDSNDVLIISMDTQENLYA